MLQVSILRKKPQANITVYERHIIAMQFGRNLSEKCLFFPDKQYFDFIRLIESIYVHNLTISLMMLYVDGDLIQAVDAKIKRRDEV